MCVRVCVLLAATKAATLPVTTVHRRRQPLAAYIVSMVDPHSSETQFGHVPSGAVFSSNQVTRGAEIVDSMLFNMVYILRLS